MSIGLGVTKTYVAQAQDLDGTGDKLTVAVVKPANVIRYGFINNNTTASGTDLELTLDHRVTAGTDTGRVELASFTPTATVAQGEGLYFDMTGRNEINPGEELVVAVDTAGATNLDGHVFVEVVEYPFVQTSADATEDRLANMTEET